MLVQDNQKQLVEDICCLHVIFWKQLFPFTINVKYIKGKVIKQYANLLTVKSMHSPLKSPWLYETAVHKAYQSFRLLEVALGIKEIKKC